MNAKDLETTNKSQHKQLSGVVPGKDGGQFCLHVAFSSWEKGKHINKISRKSQEMSGQSRDSPMKIQFMLSGLQEGPAERGHVKKRQKSSKSVKKIFDTFRQFSRRAKNRQKSSRSVKIFLDTFRQFSRGTSFPAPFGGL